MRLGVILVALAILLNPVVVGQTQETRKGVMVVDFEDTSGAWSSTREVVTTRVISKLREDASLRVLPREQVQEALRLARVETSGFLDWEAAQKVARGLGADFVVMGRVTAFDQQYSGGCLPIVGCAYTITATVSLQGKVLAVATGTFVLEPKSEVKKQQGSISVWVGPWWSTISVSNFDSQLIGRATLEAVEDFVNKVRASLR